MKAFKFLAATYAQDLLDGKVYFNSASAMRTADGYDDGRSDDQELISRGYIHSGEQVLRNGHPHAGFYRGPGDVVVTGYKSEIIDDSYLLYCMAVEFNKDVAASMREKFAADACVEICDIEAFFDVIATHPFLHQYGCDLAVGPVRYELEERVSIQDAQGIDPFVKRKKYAWQKECRIVIRGLPIDKAILLNIPMVRTLVRRIL